MSNPLDNDPALQEALSKSRDKRQSGTNTKVTLGLAGAVLLAGGFFGGYAVRGSGDDAGAATFRAGGPRGQVQEGPGGGPAGDATFGTVKSVDGDVVTIETDDGKTVEVTADSDTEVTINSKGKVSDLGDGDTVIVTGDADDEGDVDADSITERGGIRMGGPQASS